MHRVPVSTNCVLLVTLGLLWTCGFAQEPQRPGAEVAISNRLELFVDRALVEKLGGSACLRIHEPAPAGIALRFDEPWEGSFSGYITVLRDGGLFRMYYRGLPTSRADGSTSEVTCYAESANGITWVKPKLGLFEVQGTRSNNVVLAALAPFSHNFAPFLDLRPGVAPGERFKALAGTLKTGLVPFVSADGLRWKKLREQPVLTEGAFDSQNVSFWSESERCYVAYFRTWTGGKFSGYRTVSRATSNDFLDWSAASEMTFGDVPPEHLYTSQTHPYFRAPHIYLATPMRFVPGRKILTDEQAAALGVRPGYASDCADTVLLATRGGLEYTRLFMEALIRPGPDLGNWASRAGMTALGIIPTGPAEISLFKQAHYAQPSAHLIRYTLRTDGFVSVNAAFAGGELVTRPLRFAGRELVINFATSAAGSIRVEILDAQFKPLPGFTLAEAQEIGGDEIERVVHWQGGSDLSSLAEQPIRLRFVMKDADLYSLRFR